MYEQSMTDSTIEFISGGRASSRCCEDKAPPKRSAHPSFSALLEGQLSVLATMLDAWGASRLLNKVKAADMHFA
jgi:hypothetical protein